MEKEDGGEEMAVFDDENDCVSSFFGVSARVLPAKLTYFAFRIFTFSCMKWDLCNVGLHVLTFEGKLFVMLSCLFVLNVLY